MNAFKISRNIGIYQEMSLRQGSLNGHHKYLIPKKTVIVVKKEYFCAYHELNFMRILLSVLKTNSSVDYY